MSRTGIVRDDLFIEHNPGDWHPESPDRLRAIHQMLDSRDWSDMVTLERRSATRDEICLVHTPDHFDRVAKTDGVNQGAFDADTHYSAQSFNAALAAAGGLISLTEKVLDGELSNGFALVRPPGHHAEASRPMGFCLFNNVAVAAAWAKNHKGLSRIMIVDWDLHHGNGTQHSFYTDPGVLYFSTHQYPYYPGTGALGEAGRNEGLGFNINVPLSWGHTDHDYIAIFKKIVMPVAIAYKPELILVSAGFDIYQGDPLGGMRVTSEGFAAMTLILKAIATEICGGRLVVTLEGGYHLDGQATGVQKVLEVITGYGLAGKELAGANPPEPKIVDQVRKIQAQYWKF